jgi:glycosyltransferase involved in cell wall biosynthesis
MPTPATTSAGPLSLWITAAGWAEAAGDVYGRSWLVTPSGVLTPGRARAMATGGGAAPGPRSSWRRRVPTWVGTLRKDARQAAHAIRFHRSGLDGPWVGTEVAFVWQHHELFHRSGFAAGRKFRSPVVVFVDAPIVWEGARWGVRRPGWGWAAERWAEAPQLRRADLVACVSEEVAEQVVALGADSDRVIVTPCAVDVARFQPSTDERDRRREQLGLHGRFVVGWLGTFHRFHGLELLIEAFERLADDVPEATLLLIGDGLDRGRIEQVASRAAGDIRFTGAIRHDEVPSHLSALDVATVVDPGTSGFHYSPLKLKEYMACGLAVVAPRSGQLEDTLVDGEEALLVSPGDSAAVAEALVSLASDPDRRARLGVAAREFVLRTSTWTQQVEAVRRELAR